jgi:hypothetical protein
MNLEERQVSSYQWFLLPQVNTLLNPCPLAGPMIATTLSYAKQIISIRTVLACVPRSILVTLPYASEPTSPIFSS